MHREGQFCHQIIKSWQLPTRVGVVTHTLRPTIQISNYNSRTIIQSTGNIYLLSLFEIFTYSLNCTLIFLFSASIGPVLLFLNKLSLKFSLWQQALDVEIILCWKFHDCDWPHWRWFCHWRTFSASHFCITRLINFNLIAGIILVVCSAFQLYLCNLATDTIIVSGPVNQTVE